jgi:arylsulfatase A-like enzyme
MLIDPEQNVLLSGQEKLQTENVILVVIDGPRFSETWGDHTRQYIPNLGKYLAPQGVIYTNFYNEGPTLTIPGHAAITTGQYHNLNNSGSEYPQAPSIFQVFLNQTKKQPEKVCLLTSKSKLTVLSDCTAPNWRGKYIPHFDVKDRNDQETFQEAIEILDVAAPDLMLIHFKGPDDFGHQGLWNEYLQSIRETDHYVRLLWDHLQQNPRYRDKTALLMTNDHGRHADGVDTGFVSHGDRCEGCRHIIFFAIGPDFRKGLIIDTKREQIDIAPTIARLLGFSMPGSEGAVMTELFDH